MTVSNDDTTFTSAVPVLISTLLPSGGSQIIPDSQSAAVPLTISNDQTTLTTDVPLVIPTPSANLPGTIPISVPVTISNDETTFTDAVVVAPTILPSGVSDVLTSVPLVVSNEQITLSTVVPVVVPTSLEQPNTQPSAVPVTISNDQTTFTTDVPLVVPDTSVVAPVPQPTAAVTISNDQTTFTFTTGVPLAVPDTSVTAPVQQPTAQVTISNDQTTFTTDVPLDVPDTSVVAPVPQLTAQVTISNDQITLTTGGFVLTNAGTLLPTVTPDNAFSTAVTLSNGQVVTTTGGAGSGSIPPIIVQPTTKGESTPPLVSGQASITGDTPENPLTSSGGIIVGPLTVITPTAGVSGTATPTNLGEASQSLGGAATQTAGLTPTGSGTVAANPSQSVVPSGAGPITGTGQIETTETGTAAPNPVQSGESSGSAQIVGTGQSQTSGDAINTNSITNVATAGVPSTLAGDSAANSGGPSATTGSEEATTVQAIAPQYTTTGETSSVTYGATPGAPQTIEPIGSDTRTAIPIPTSLVHAPTASPTQTSEFIPVALPSSVPPLIQPPDGMPQQPPDTTRIQVGFLRPLNYAFVVNSEVTQEQIFDFLPPGIAYGLNIPVKNVIMETLKADDTSTDLTYIRTLALAFIPSNQVDNLYLHLHTPAHPIYHNPNASVSQLMSFIDPSVAIQADNPMSGSSGPGGSGSDAQASPSDPAQGGAPIGGDIGKDMPVRKSSVAIGVGVVCGAAAYGAAMFFIARRYKMRRQSHGRSPSTFSSPVYSGSHHDFMGGANAALMSGARGDGGRSATPPLDGFGYGRESRGSGRSGSTGRQQISAPVMAENSLGWN